MLTDGPWSWFTLRRRSVKLHKKTAHYAATAAPPPAAPRAEPALPAGGFDARRVDFEAVVPWREGRLREARTLYQHAGDQAGVAVTARHVPTPEQLDRALAAWPELGGHALVALLVTAFGDIFVEVDNSCLPGSTLTVPHTHSPSPTVQQHQPQPN